MARDEFVASSGDLEVLVEYLAHPSFDLYMKDGEPVLVFTSGGDLVPMYVCGRCGTWVDQVADQWLHCVGIPYRGGCTDVQPRQLDPDVWH